MRQAFKQAISRAELLKANDEPGRRSVSVVVLSNGNNFSSDSATERAIKSKTPVDVVDVSDK